ncbi:MAG: hypothetical protein R6U38_03385 [Desulfatiglandaceae bacterium]
MKESPAFVQVSVEPGICGFTCSIRALRQGKRVGFEILSDCFQVRRLASCMGRITVRDLFLPLRQSPIFLCAEKSECHLACPIPMAVVKAAEVALGLALPKDATLTFEDPR